MPFPNPFSSPMSSAPAPLVGAGNNRVGPANAPATGALGAAPGLLGNISNVANKAWDATKGFVGDQIAGIGNQWDRAKATYGFNRYMGNASPWDAGMKAFGSLDQGTRGVAGGGMGLLASGLLSPKSMRGVTMPLATGAGAMFAAAHGPQGFKWENLAKPEALMAGGLGLGAGYLGSQLMGTGDDEEEDDNGRPVQRRESGGGSSWLPALGTLGALGLGGYALYRNSQPPAAGLSNQASQMAGNAAQAAAPQPTASDVSTIAAPPQAQAPAVPAAQPPVVTPTPPPAPEESIKPPGAPAVNTAAQTFTNNPEKWQEYAASKGTLPGPQENLRKLISQYHQSELPGAEKYSAIPQLSSIYEFAHAHPSNPASQALLSRAQQYVSALDSARKATAPGWDDLSRLEGLKATPGQPASFGVGGLESLGAFGFKDLNHLAQAAAQGDPKVLQTIQAMGREGQESLFKALTQPGFSNAEGSGGQKLSLPASAAHPHASALLGAARAAAGTELKPEPYNPLILGAQPDDLRRSMTPGQKLQLMQDLKDHAKLDEMYGPMDPEARLQHARNVGGLFTRNARGAVLPGGENTLAEIPSWLDEPMQQSVARIAGNPNYRPVAPAAWRELAYKGLDSSLSLSPFSQGKNYKTQADMTPEISHGYSPLDIVLNRSQANDDKVLGDWASALTSGSRKFRIPGMTEPTPEQAGPLALSLRRLAQIRPDLYDHLVNKLEQNAGKYGEVGDFDVGRHHWREHLAKMIDQPGLNYETGGVHSGAGRATTPLSVPR